MWRLYYFLIKGAIGIIKNNIPFQNQYITNQIAIFKK